MKTVRLVVVMSACPIVTNEIVRVDFSRNLEGGFTISFAPHSFMGHTSQGFVALQAVVLFSRGESVTRCHTNSDTLSGLV
jgi:hypothetical protein